MLGIGIIGLPNVGKSTLFNALLKKQQALAANYPFATIEPNIGVVPVPDERLEKLAEITAEEIASSSTPRNDDIKLPPIKNALVEFVDIAGLVKGASEGAGLGNKFLSHIREVKVIAHVVRVFEDADVIREGSVGVKEDYEIIQTELILADLQTLDNSKVKTQKSKVQVKGQNEILEQVENSLNKGISARSLKFNEEEQKFVNQLGLLSSKPEIIVLNVSEDMYSDSKNEETIKKYSELLFGVTASGSEAASEIASSQAPRNDKNIVVICAKVESELSELSSEDGKEYLKELGVEKSGLERLIQNAYARLGLISFLTCGEIEVKAWTIKAHSTAVEAAGAIHTDFMAKFIKAEVVAYDDFICEGSGLALTSEARNGWKGSRAAGKARLEGKDYVMGDGDVVEFKIGR